VCGWHAERTKIKNGLKNRIADLKGKMNAGRLNALLNMNSRF
jgi:hypothetical protein